MACMKFLFGSWVLCKNTDVAVEVSRKYKGNQINQITKITKTNQINQINQITKIKQINHIESGN